MAGRKWSLNIYGADLAGSCFVWQTRRQGVDCVIHLEADEYRSLQLVM
jgi:hypothetical protein